MHSLTWREKRLRVLELSEQKGMKVLITETRHASSDAELHFLVSQ